MEHITSIIGESSTESVLESSPPTRQNMVLKEPRGTKRTLKTIKKEKNESPPKRQIDRTSELKTIKEEKREKIKKAEREKIKQAVREKIKQEGLFVEILD